MEEKSDWRPISGPGLLEGTEVDYVTGDVRVRHPGESDEDGTAGDPEPRKPKIPPTAGAMAIELAQVALDE